MTATATKQYLFRLVVNGTRVRGAGLYLPSVPPVGDVLTQKRHRPGSRAGRLSRGRSSYILVLSTGRTSHRMALMGARALDLRRRS